MNSVQAQQFAAIQKATTTYHNETKTADHMRRREVDMMNREQERQKRVEEELRIAHGSVGEETRKKKNLEVERKRLVQSTEADRQANIKITSELKGIEADEKEQKTKFVKEMESLCDERYFLLTQRENKKTNRYLDSDEVNWLLETKINDFVSSDGGQNEDDANWTDVAARVKDELTGLIEIENKGNETINELNRLEQFREQLREKLMSEHGNLGEMEIDDLEAKWEQNYVYDDQEEEQGDGNAMDLDGSKAKNNGSLASENPIHMQVFYGNNEYINEEYIDPVYDNNATSTIGEAC